MNSDFHRLNILFLSSWFPHQDSPTLGNFVHRHAQAVAVLNDVHVLYLAPTSQSKLFIEEISLEGVPCTIAYVPQHKNIFFKYQTFRKLLSELENKGKKFDLIHHNVIWPDGWQALLASRKWLIPYVITEHWTGYDRDERGPLPLRVKLMARYIAKRAAAILPVSKNLGEAMQNQGISGNYRSVPNVVNEELFQVGDKNKFQKIFLHVSTFNESQKNISGILRAWKKFSDKEKNVKLLLGGDGHIDEAQQYAEDLQINPDRISFFTRKTWKEVATMMSEAHALIIFSNYENLPCVMIEALSSGMKVIATSVGGIPEYIHSNNGILIPKRDESALLEALKKIASDDYSDDWAKELKERADAEFGYKAVSKKFDQVYREVLLKKIK